MRAKAIKSVRGMNDLLPPESHRWRHVEAGCRRLFAAYGYGEIRTPVVEDTALFARGIGDATDIVEKEMYTFADRKGRSLTMRPEMTASCARAYIQHGVSKREPVTRWYYIAPMFRYERKQVGRYRQFFQIGVEAFGVAEPSVDAEQIAMLHRLFAELGIDGIEVVVNSVGTAEDRQRYRQVLVDFLAPKRAALCADCQRRMDSNPLRVLDCKVASCKEIVVDAPVILDHLGDASRAHFAAVDSALTALAVPFRVDPRLVRGLDYYTATVFEIMATSGELGSQSTLVAGGRYDNLVESLGGPATPAMGFSIGIERVVMSLPAAAVGVSAPRPDAFIVTHGDEARASAMALADKLRASADWYIEIEHRKVGLKAQFKRADKLGARLVLVIGEDELARAAVTLRDMSSREERSIAIADLEAELRSTLARVQGPGSSGRG